MSRCFGICSFLEKMMFKKGDVVERCFNNYDGVEVGQCYLVREDQTHAGLIYLDGKDFPFDGTKFKAASVVLRPVANVAPGIPGRKDDSGKLDMTLLDDMPRALAAVVEVMQWAVTKKQPVPYDRSSWLGVHADRYRAALLRHNGDAAKQVGDSDGRAARFQPDKETNLLHLAHIACSAMMALENTLREMERNA